MTYEMYEELLRTLQQIRDRLPEGAMVEVEPLTINAPSGVLETWVDVDSQHRYRPPGWSPKQASPSYAAGWRKVYVEKLR